MGSQQLKVIDLSKLPSYVPRKSAEFLMQSCGRKSPRLERVLFDLRTKSVWEMLCDTFSNEDDIAYLIRSTLIAAAADYSPARGQRKILSAKYSDISDRCTQLADDIESLLRLSEDIEHTFDSGFAWADLANVRSLLRESSPKTSPAIGGTDPKQHEETWNAAKYWACADVGFFDGARSWTNTAEMVQRSVTYLDSEESGLSVEDESRLKLFLDAIMGSEKDEVSMDEPTEGALKFLDGCWAFAPLLPDILRQASWQVSEHLRDNLGATTEAEMVLQSRKSSAKRDYLRVLWGRLFSYESPILVIFEDSKDKLNKIIAALSTVILDLDADDIVTEHDVRQSRNKVLPHLEKQFSEFAEDSPPGTYDEKLEVIRRWNN